MSLKDYGWTPFFAPHFEPHRQQGLRPGRIVLTHGHTHQVLTAGGEAEAEVSGRLRHQGDDSPDLLPAIGDWVALTLSPGGGTSQIQAVLPRRSKLSRKVAGRRTREQVVAANVDTVFLVMGLDGDYSPRRIERFLVMVWESGSRPVVLLNKADLEDDPEARLAEIEAVAPGVPVHLLSVLEGLGIEALDDYLLPGETIALVGSSGVGKSSLINRLMGREILRTRIVRSRDDRGQHTTTHRQLIRLPAGALLIDNPGIRELQLWASDGIDKAFEDIDDLAARCRFSDCRHQDEPGCAVRSAVADGTLPKDRLASLHTLEKELRYLELRQDERARRAEKKRVAAIHKAAKRHKPRRS